METSERAILPEIDLNLRDKENSAPTTSNRVVIHDNASKKDLRFTHNQLLKPLTDVSHVHLLRNIKLFFFYFFNILLIIYIYVYL